MFIVLVLYYLVYYQPLFCYLARLFTMHHYASLDPKFVLHFIKSLHVDDLISGADSLLEVQNFFVKCKERLATASFNLRKFISNSGSLNYRINMLHMKIIRLKFSDLCGT